MGWDLDDVKENPPPQSWVGSDVELSCEGFQAGGPVRLVAVVGRGTDGCIVVREGPVEFLIPWRRVVVIARRVD